MIASALIPLSLAAGQTFTVDDDGPADFADLPAAVAAAQSGDEIHVMPGSYSAFATGKGLTVLGPAAGPRPSIGGETVVSGAGSFTLAGLALRDLVLADVPGRISVDDCAIGWGEVESVGEIATFRIKSCAQVVISGSAIRGKTGDVNYWETPGIEIAGSTVAVVDCTVQGGDGGAAWPGPCGYDGRPGIEVEPTYVAGPSYLLVAGSSIEGGEDGPYTVFAGCTIPRAAPAIWNYSGESTLIVRGSSFDVLAKPLDAEQFTSPEAAIYGAAESTVISGVTLVPNAVLGPASFPSPPEPYIELAGGHAPGDTWRLNAYGPPGTAIVAGLSLGPTLSILPGFSGLLWIDPLLIYRVDVLFAAGQDVPASALYTAPANPALAGLALPVQAVELGALLLANPDTLAIRF